MHICAIYVYCVLYPWYCYLCIYQQCFIATFHIERECTSLAVFIEKIPA